MANDKKQYELSDGSKQVETSFRRGSLHKVGLLAIDDSYYCPKAPYDPEGDFIVKTEYRRTYYKEGHTR